MNTNRVRAYLDFVDTLELAYPAWVTKKQIVARSGRTFRTVSRWITTFTHVWERRPKADSTRHEYEYRLIQGWDIGGEL